MNLKHEWVIPFFLALTLSVCLFIIVDITYDERIWEFSFFTLKARVQAFGVTMVSLSGKLSFSANSSLFYK